MAQIFLPGWVGGLTVIIKQISVQIVLNWNWPTGTELGNISDETTEITKALGLENSKLI